MKIAKWLKETISHKIDHLRWSNIRALFRKHGLALVIIIVGWEIVEDVLFPVLFGLLGKYVHPGFYAGIPASLIICLHWLAVPLLWSMWVGFSGRKDGLDHVCGGVCGRDALHGNNEEHQEKDHGT